MIKTFKLNKSFDKTKVLEDIDITVRNGSIYGIIGVNGAGKSTLLSILAGVYNQDSGDLLVDGERVFENSAVKGKIAYIQDDPYFFGQYSPIEMAKYYQKISEKFDMGKFVSMGDAFKLPLYKKINTFSKGMARQCAIMLSIAREPEILLCDESFDGLDPLARNILKQIIIGEVSNRNMTVIISSHNLYELENLCDTIAVIANNKMLIEQSIDDIKEHIHKVQFAIRPMVESSAFDELDIVSYVTRQSVCEMIVHGDIKDILEKINSFSPILVDVLELSLEEIFIYEMEAIGYDFKNLLY